MDASKPVADGNGTADPRDVKVHNTLSLVDAHFPDFALVQNQGDGWHWS